MALKKTENRNMMHHKARMRRKGCEKEKEQPLSLART
jgi:hypothetical protein